MSEETNPQEEEQAKSNFEETTENIKDEAKSTANDFKEGWNEATSGDNKKMMAGILAIILGSFGVHKFILGYNKEGMILLGGTILGYATLCIGVGAFILMATGIVGLIEGIIYLTKSDEEFVNTYQVGRKPWF